MSPKDGRGWLLEAGSANKCAVTVLRRQCNGEKNAGEGTHARKGDVEEDSRQIVTYVRSTCECLSEMYNNNRREGKVTMKALKVLVAVVVAMMMVAPSTFALHQDDVTDYLSALGITFSGYVRSQVSLDIKKTEGAAADGGDLDETVFGSQAKGLIDFAGVAPSTMMGLTGSAKVTLIMDAGGASSDDAWVALSNESMELKMGRFEAEDLQPFGNDYYYPDAEGAPAVYLTNKARGRAVTGVSVTMNASDTMKVSVGGIYGNSGDNFFGIRPLVKITTGALTIAGGGEYYIESPTDNDAESESSVIGFGGYAQFGMGAMTLNAGAGYGMASSKDAAGDDLPDENTLTATGWMTMGVGENGTLGVGVRYTVLDVEDVDDDDTYLQAYVSHTIKPFMYANTQLEIGAGYGGADLAGDITNTNFGVATRLRYNF